MTRHKLTEATNFATRAAAIARTTDTNEIRNLITNRMGGPGAGCSAVIVDVTTQTDALGLTQLLVNTRCSVSAGFGGNLLGAIGPDTLSVSAAMPF